MPETTPGSRLGGTLTSTIWLTEGPDLLDLSLSERHRLTENFGSWLESLPVAVTIVICSRRGTPPTTDPRASPLEMARQSHLAAQSGAGGPHLRSTHLVVGDVPRTTAESLVASLMTTCEVKTQPVSTLPSLVEGPASEHARGLRVGGSWVASARLLRPPAVVVETGWIWEIAKIPAEYDLSLRIIPRTAAAADRAMRRRMRGLRARELVGSAAGTDPALLASMEAAQHFRTVLATRQGRLFEVGMTISLAAGSQVEVRRLVQELRASGSRLQSRWVPAWFDEGPARLETLADPMSGGSPRLTVETAELATLWPWLGRAELPRGDRSLLGRHQRTGGWVSLNLHSELDLPNSNLAVVASSGGGKSYLAGLLGLEAVRRDQRVVVLDPENEHRRWCEGAGGAFVDLARSGCAFNVMELGNGQERVAAAVDLVALLCGPLESSEQGALMSAVTLLGTRNSDSQPVLGDCVPLLQQDAAGRKLATRLTPWVTGPPGLIFSRPGLGPKVTSVVGIGIRDLPPTWIPATALVVAMWLWEWIKSSHGPKQVIVDEAGLLADNPALQRLMAHLARRIRKYQGALVLLTQTGADLTSHRFGEVVLVNSATLLLGAQNRAGARRLQEAIGFDDLHRRWLEQAGRGSFLLVAGHRRVPVQVEAPGAYQQWLGRSDGPGPPTAADLDGSEAGAHAV